MPVVLKAGESKTTKASFEARVSLPKCEFAFDLAGDCAPEDYKLNSGDNYCYTFSHISLTKSVFSY